jgi:hypothetical protein
LFTAQNVSALVLPWRLGPCPLPPPFHCVSGWNVEDNLHLITFVLWSLRRTRLRRHFEHTIFLFTCVILTILFKGLGFLLSPLSAGIRCCASQKKAIRNLKRSHLSSKHTSTHLNFPVSRPSQPHKRADVAGSNGYAPGLYSEGDKFETRPGHRLGLRVILSPYWHIPRQCLALGHDHVLFTCLHTVIY